MKIGNWKKTSEDGMGITYENAKRSTVLDIVTPYHFGKNSFIAVSISGHGTKTYPNIHQGKVSVIQAKKMGMKYMRENP